MKRKSNRFVWETGDIGISQCAFCEHKHKYAGTCDAFPAGIPDPILLNQHDHRLTYDGDRGILFSEAQAVRKWREKHEGRDGDEKPAAGK